MSETTEALRHSQEHTLDMIEMANFNDGFEAAIDAIDELSNALHNQGDTTGAEILRWAAKELRGENV
jgi:soluble cytochrome b562